MSYQAPIVVKEGSQYVVRFGHGNSKVAGVYTSAEEAEKRRAAVDAKLKAEAEPAKVVEPVKPEPKPEPAKDPKKK